MELKYFSFLFLSLFVLGFSFQVKADTLDTTPPVISLLGSATVNLTVGDSYTDAGATALDDVDGDITSHIVVVNPVDTSTAGTYTVTYNVSDAAGNNATQVTRTVIVSNPLPPALNETFIIRNGNTIIWQGTTPLPANGTISVTDSNHTAHDVNARSVLGVLYALDQTNNSFALSNIQYFDSFSSFYLKCLQPAGGANLCDNWQFAVGSVSPFTSIDTTILNGGETVGIYFGSSHQVVLSSLSVMTNENFTATAQSYDYVTNTWNPLTAETIGVTLPNPTDQWNPTVVATFPVNSSGVATITLANPNTYTIGIVEDFYFPSYTIVVQRPAVGGTTPDTSTPVTTPTISFSVPKALAYLKANQSNDGSFGNSDLYTDWAAIAFAAANYTDSSRDLLLSYVHQHAKLFTLLTDNERRTMALLALGQNPYNFENINYIDSITKSFDGTQFGDPNLVNDDIFALIPLTSSGYSAYNDMITKDIAFIVSKQATDGSWETSVDLTAAAVQALSPYEKVSGVTDALTKAKTYLTSKQNSDGSFGTIFTSSWVIQALKPSNSTDYLAKQQSVDGAALSGSETKQNRIWATSYAIPASLNMSWGEILKSVEKPIIETPTPEIIPVANPIIVVPEKKVLGEKITADATDSNKKVSTVKKIEKPEPIITSTINPDEKPVQNSTPVTSPKQFPKTIAIIATLLVLAAIITRFVL